MTFLSQVNRAFDRVSTENSAIVPASDLTPNVGLPPASQSLLFIDAGVDDIQTLVNAAGSDTEVYVLQSGQDAVAQITQTLLGRSGIASLQIISHGRSGGLQLGESWLDVQSLPGYVGQLKSWGKALSADADILLYGCNVAQDATGQAFVHLLAQATGADVAASDDLTGNAALGGDWDLEVTTGAINFPLVFAAAVQQRYQGRLDDAFFAQVQQFTSGNVGTDSKTIVDALGNRYTVGNFSGTVDFDPGTGENTLTSVGLSDIFISKLDTSGNYLWVKQFGSTNNESANSVAIDASGNVYTTGHFSGTVDFDPGAGTSNLTSTGLQDIFISKLDSSGNYLWAKRIGGTNPASARSVAIDGSGNVYTTGTFAGTTDFDPGAGASNLTSAGNNDIFISKLDSNGNYLWAKQFGGTNSDSVNSVAVDSSGNVYTTGAFEGTIDFDPGTGTNNLTSAGVQDVFINKLDSNGNYLWAKRFGSTNVDIAYSTAIDGSGNVYTTGFFNGTVDFDPGASTNTLTSAGISDIFISKLDSSGNYLWAKQLGGASTDSANSVTVDSSGNVYTTGSFWDTADFDPGVGTKNFTSAGAADIFISKIDSNGNYLWAKQIGGTSYDIGNSVTIDASGNVYTTGSFTGTADFDPGAGTSTLATGGASNLFLSKLNAVGDFAQAQQFTSGGLSNNVSKTVVDSLGNRYIVGSFSGTVDFDPGAGTNSLTSDGSLDIFITKQASDGILIWAKKMGGTSNDIATNVTVDNNGNIYTTGSFQGTATFGSTSLTSAGMTGASDIFITKQASDGTFIWAKAMGGTSSDQANGVAVDSSGNVYTTGYFAGLANFGSTSLTSAGPADIFITKQASDGTLIWAKAMGGTSFDQAHAVTVDSSGNVYTTGYFQGTAIFGSTSLTSAGGQDIFITKQASDGTLLWAKKMGGTSGDVGNDVTVDSSGNIYTTGFFGGTATFGSTSLTSAGNQDIFITKQASDGTLLWAKQMGGTSNDQANDVVLDSGGNIYTTGYFQSTATFGSTSLTSTGGSDIYITKQASDGTLLWAKKMGGTRFDEAHGVAVDSSGNVYTTGYFQVTADFDPGAGMTNLATGGTTNIFLSKLSQLPPSIAPIITLPSGTATYTENAVPTLLDLTATVADTDSTNFDTGKLTVRFSSGSQPTDRLSIQNQTTGANPINLDGRKVRYGTQEIGTYTGGMGVESLVITFNANATPAIAQEVIRSLSYANASDDPGNGNRTIELVLTDGDGGTSAPVTKTVQVTPVNDAPLIASRKILYNGINSPVPQGWINNLTGGTTSSTAGGVHTVVSNTLGGTSYFRTDQILDATAGFLLSFQASVIAETLGATANKNNDGKTDRAVLSLTLVTNDPTKAIELGFSKNGGSGLRIFAQEDGTRQINPAIEPDTAPIDNTRQLFTQAEGVDITTDPGLGNYDLYVKGNTYTLFLNGNPILSGNLRNYVAFNGAVDPYDDPNWLGFSDNTPSASGTFGLGTITLLTGGMVDRVINEDSGSIGDSFGVFDVERNPTIVTATSSNATVIPTASALGSGTSRTLFATPDANQFGTSNITISANDGNSSNVGFNVTVNSVNDAPTFSIAGNQTTIAGAGAQTINAWALFNPGGGTPESTQTATYEILNNSNPSLFATLPQIDANGTLTYTPVNGMTGSATIELRVRDSGGTANGGVDIAASQLFTITVNPQTVNLSAIDTTATEAAGDTGTYRIVRNQAGGSQTIAINITGTASTADYSFSLDSASVTAGVTFTIAGSILNLVLPNGVLSADLILTPVDDIQAEGSETVKLDLANVAIAYILGTSKTGTVTIARNDFVVTNTNNAGEGSLRQATLNAAVLPGADTISFAGGTFTDGTPDVITLTTGELVINSDVTINGTGADRLTISGNNNSTVFNLGSGSVTLNNLTIANGRSTVAGGGIMQNGGTVRINNSVITNNDGSFGWLGGGIYQSAGSLTLVNTTVSNNIGGYRGGGGIGSMDNTSLVLINSTIVGNRADNADYGGGGIFTSGNATLVNTTISGNSTNTSGGGIRFYTVGPAPSVNIINSTIADNIADKDANGIGDGGGIFQDAPTSPMTIANTIVANNREGGNSTIHPDVSGSFVDGGNNLIGKTDGSTGFAVSTLVGTIANPLDPQLAALANNGGTTQTYALLNDSVAINAGSNAALPNDTVDLDGDGNVTEVLPFDQRGTGFARQLGNRVDIGAVESSVLNRPPVNTVPGLQTVNEDTAIAIPGIVITDRDSNLATTQLTVTNGKLTVNLTGTATISSGANNAASLTLSGSQADINGTLASLSYQGNLNYSGNDTLTIISTDNAGVPLSDTDTVAIVVNPINDAPTGTVTIGGTTTQGQTLTATNNLADADGLGTLTYQWQADGTDIANATGNSLVLGQAEVGKVIRVKVGYTDLRGTPESVTSVATGTIANVNDLPTGSVTISGSGTKGQTLTAANNLADADGLGAVTYQWQANGVDIAGATGATLLLAQAQVGKVITAKASYTDLLGTAESVSSTGTAAITNVNDSPTGSVTISGTATQAQTLTASNTLADGDGLGTIGYQWLADGVNIPGATGDIFVLTQAQVGKVIVAKAIYTDGQGTIEAVASIATSPVVNVNDASIGTINITGTAAENQTLTASNNLTDVDGLGTVTYQWQADGVDIVGATAATLALGQAQVGKVITAKASYTDGQGTVESVLSTGTAAIANVNDLPTGTVTISGTATQGQTLTAANTLADVDGLGTLTYQWQANGVDIAGATTNSFVLTQAQVGKVIVAKARYTDAQGTGESVTSAGTAAVVNVNDLPTGTVTISGTATEDQTLTAANNLADIDGLGTVSYQWQADGVDIAGATAATLVLGQAQVGKVIRVKANYIDLQNTTESVTSSGTVAVVNVNDLPTGAITIAGTATEDQTLTVSNTLADADGLGGMSYQWQANGIDIAGATGTSLLLDQTFVGKVITAKASYIDGQGTAESVASVGTAAVLNVNDLPTGAVTISGTAAEDQTLTAANTLADADGLGSITYQWQASGVDITGATGATFVLGQAQVGKVITVKASYTDLLTTPESVTSGATIAVTNVNDLPTGAVTIAGTAAEDQTLTATNTLADADGLGTVTYQWQANGVNITGATGATLLLDQTSVGKTITLQARYTDAQGTAESVVSAPTIAVTNINDLPIGAVTIAGTPTQGQTLTASNNLTDADGLGTIGYQWQADNIDIVGATGTSFVLRQAQVGKVMTVKVGYTDLQGTAESVVSAGTAAIALNRINQPPIGTVTIAGTAAEAQTLTASNNLTDGDGLGPIAYQWQANGADIAGATGATVVLDQAQVGKVITVTASYTDLRATPESVTSVGTVVVVNVNDTPTGSVIISGTTTENQTLTASNTLADNDGLGTVTYQWQADGVDIVGATGTTLVLAAAQVGKAIGVKARYTDLQGSAESVSSPATGLVGSAPIVTQPGIQTPNNLTTIAGVAVQSVPNWATDLTQPAYPVGLSYVVTVDRPELFAQLPTLTPTGQLVYEPKPYVNLNALVNLTIQVKQADGSLDPNLTKNATLNIKYKPEALIRNSATNEVGLLYVDQVTQIQAQRNLTQAGQNVKITPEWAIADTADFNRDGVADILLHNQSGDEVSIWMMGTNGQVMAAHALTGQAGQILKTGNLNWKVVGFADIDRDNILDIVWHNQQSDEVAFWFMNADGINVRSYDYLRDGNGAILKTGNPLWQAKAIADFDGDGDSDLLLQLPELNQTAIVQLNGQSLVNYQYIASPTEMGFAIRGVGDSNGDRIADIYWQNAENTRVVIQTIAPQTVSNNFTTVASIAPLQAIGDLDLNNTSDLLFRSTGLLLDLVNPAQPQSSNIPLQQQGQSFQFGDINWNVVQTDDFGDLTP
jgi:Domain of unknown function (DUF4347)/Beta-propeller repeat